MSNRISSNASVGCGAFKNVAILFTIILISIGCADSSAQSTNHDNRLVGTWVKIGGQDSGEEWVFNSNGTGTAFEKTVNYGAVDNKIVFMTAGKYYGSTYEYYFSKDGKTLLLWSDDGGYILQKKQ